MGKNDPGNVVIKTMNLKQSNGDIVEVTERKIDLEDMRFHRGQVQAQLNQMDSDINEVETFMEGK